MLAPTLLASGVDMLAVASIDEGLDLRNAKITCDILNLGAVPVWAFECAVENDITLSIFSEEHILACKQAYERTGEKVKVHIKIDTGMNRIGVSKNEAVDFIKKVQDSDFIDLKGIFSHLACAEDETETENQLKTFTEITSQVDTSNLTRHILNTAGLMSYPEYQFDMVRAGIGLYGLMPDLASRGSSEPVSLLPVMSLKGRITRIHTMPKGEGISYGHTFVAEKDIKVATVPIGYADGVPRALSNKIYGEINGRKIKQIGNITMDQMMFDISDVNAQEGATEGDIVMILGENLTIDEWAKILGTINYELTCRLKVRLPRVYTR
jgi:alanine racemase